MTHWIKGDYHPQPDAHIGSGERQKVIYWWPPLTGPDHSASLGLQMLIGTIVWLVFCFLLVVTLGVLLT